MKPVIITLNSDNKVVMSVDEFKRHMDAAYNQGYSDGNSAATTITATPYNQRWWYDVTCNNTSLTDYANNHITLADNTTADTCDCISGHCNCSAECENQISISSYLRSKGE